MARQARFGPSEPLHIYQDDFYENSAPMISHATMPPAPQTHRRPLQSANGNVILNPPAVSGVKISPFKSDMQTGSQLMPLSAPGNRLNMMSMMPPSMMPPSMMPPNHMSHPTDNLEKKQPVMSKFRTGGHKAGSECGMPKYYNKENMHPVLYPAPLGMAFYPQPEEYVGRSSGKRSLLEAAPIKELRPAKKMRLDEQVLPAPDSFPLIFDDGTKPGHSYATLIGMAILRSPQRRLTLAQIYKWISDTYSFYNPNDAGWQNSIRHNLSLNKNFVKQERPKDDPGKGNYWAIEQGAEHLFMKEKPTRKTVNSPENVSVIIRLL
ncbi:hypothetical protein P8C59_003854 [Phyllachora maydis]|uniref:Fork-head domain-containing protein n=1 Tax=Phyllachora maydis TaxID=1825666 RepID=A0AAD9MAR6_9PEZI|nr:hypothetical protein P8C59_003854 [Phyllachora maydis]